jgi:hypothetical protein
MIRFTTIIKQFGAQGEKTGWTYVEIPAGFAQQLKPGNKQSFRVKGKLDEYSITGVAILPMGEGNFIMPLNATMRKHIGKRKGARLNLCIEVDLKKPTIARDLMQCLADEPEALDFFNTLSQSHRNYFSKWIDSAKTEATRTKRIALAVNALSKKHHYGQMLRAQAQDRQDLAR